MDNKSGKEKLNNDLLGKVSGGYMDAGGRCGIDGNYCYFYEYDPWGNPVYKCSRCQRKFPKEDLV